VYDREKRKTALAVSRFNGLWNLEQEVKIETGETLVPYAASNNLIASECVLLPSMPIEYGFKNELIEDIRNFLGRYVDLSAGFEQVAAYYILLSWVHDRFGELPYLRLRGDFGTGKTRGLLTIGALCYKSFFASGASTMSPIFHTIDAFGGTLILDEADLPYSDAKVDLVKLLNNGTTAGMPILRTVVNRHKEFNPRAFKVFGPKIVASRERFHDDALESRFLTEETGMRPLRDGIPVHLPREMKIEALQLRNRLLHFRLCEFYKINPDVDAAMAAASPRLNQTALSLLSLVDDPEARKAMQAWLLDAGAKLAEERREAPDALVLAAALAAFANNTGTNVSIGAITEQFNRAHCEEFGAAMSYRWIGQVLRTRLGLSTKKTNGVYVIPASEKPVLVALAHRFGLAPPN
jgi:hypothetical protein